MSRGLGDVYKRQVFTYGEFIPAYENLDGIMAFYRKDDSAHILVAANFGKKPVDIELEYMLKKVLLANRSMRRSAVRSEQ